MNYYILYIESLNNTFSIIESGNNIKYEYSFSKLDSKGYTYPLISENDIVLGYKKLKGINILFKVISTNLSNNSLTLEKIMEFNEYIEPKDENLINEINSSKIIKINEEHYANIYKHLISPINKYYSEKNDNEENIDNSEFSKNRIVYGAPGTGKSFQLNKDKDKLLSEYPDNYERVTFHPDYSYANFVGTYKPIPKNKGRRITYKYIPGPFMRMLVESFKNPKKNYLLLIEEINRSNPASVFGDVFQLLDRKENGKSEFPIQTSKDMRDYLKDELNNVETELKKCDFKKIWIPKNMYIWATMNSADQGVFPMDTAFKRRWDFEYIDIDSSENDLSTTEYKIGKNEFEMHITWNNLRKSINEELLNYGINEDKLLGPYFIKSDLKEEYFLKIFKDKVLMYLFEDAAKPYRDRIFKGVSEKKRNFSKICNDFDEKGINIFHENIYTNKYINSNENIKTSNDDEDD